MKLPVKDRYELPGEKQIKARAKNLDLPFRYTTTEIFKSPDDSNQKSYNNLQNRLCPLGLKLHSSNKIRLVEKIKDAIKEMLRYTDGLQVMSYSVYISMKLGHDYTYLANIFSEVSGISIQQHIIHCKIERVKYYFLTSDISLTEISYLLHYSSVAHLSSQFKKTTGLSPSIYKQILNQKINLPGIG